MTSADLCNTNSTGIMLYASFQTSKLASKYWDDLKVERKWYKLAKRQEPIQCECAPSWDLAPVLQDQDDDRLEVLLPQNMSAYCAAALLL